jgi:hypothetical protein
MSSETITFRVDLRVDDDAVTGRLTAGDGITRVFSGRLELMAAIEAAIASRGSRPGPG